MCIIDIFIFDVWSELVILFMVLFIVLCDWLISKILWVSFCDNSKWMNDVMNLVFLVLGGFCSNEIGL